MAFLLTPRCFISLTTLSNPFASQEVGKKIGANLRKCVLSSDPKPLGGLSFPQDDWATRKEMSEVTRSQVR